jgi:hypothetical protein
MPIKYEAPTPKDLRDLKDRLGYSGKQMADLFGLASAQQFRKYCGDSAPREMSLPMLFLAGALLHPSKRVVDIFVWCKEVGAKIEFAPARDGDPE